MLRSHTCGELTAKHIGKQVTLAGWVHSVRLHGKLGFMDLRDRYGITQCVVKKNQEGFKQLKKESVVLVKGRVQERAKGQKNPQMRTGNIEVLVSSIEVLSESAQTPFKVEDKVIANEDTRLKYRYLDLRRSPVKRMMLLRHRVSKTIWDFMDERGFVCVETPHLAKSTPEGARDYLVPSRLHRGKFYALPQSPQLYKQLLMVAGMDRYFQIVKCMRDEDLRADRQPEFTQLDIEMSFVEEEDILKLVEGLMERLWREVLQKRLKTPFPRLDYREAMERFGSDSPDIRFKLELQDITEIAQDCGFKTIEGIVKSGGAVKALVAGVKASKRLSKRLEHAVKNAGCRGIIEISYTKDGFAGPSVKFFTRDSLQKLKKTLGMKMGDTAFIVADNEWKQACLGLGAVRDSLGELLFPKRDGHAFLWITRFPLMDFSKEEGRWVSNHHPFTSPVDQDLEFLEKDTGRVRSRSYDLVLDGSEVGGGSIRISRGDIQQRVFNVLGINQKEAQLKFGFFLEALRYGTPPHGGIALGLDRLVAIMGGAQSIREVIAFPKNKYAQSPMVGSPSPVSKKQLEELGIILKNEKKTNS